MPVSAWALQPQDSLFAPVASLFLPIRPCYQQGNAVLGSLAPGVLVSQQCNKDFFFPSHQLNIGLYVTLRVITELSDENIKPRGLGR